MDALNSRYSVENAVSGVPGGVQEQPGDGFRIGRILSCGYRASYLASIVVLPGGTREVRPDQCSLGIVQFSFRRLEDPG